MKRGDDSVTALSRGVRYADLMNPYEERVLDEIHQFKHPKKGALGRVIETVSAPFEDMASDFFGTELGKALAGAVSGTVELINDTSSWTVQQELIFAEFRGDGHAQVQDYEDVLGLDLEEVDKTVGYLATKYKSLAFVEGGVSGSVGAVGIVADIPVLVGIALRACNEYAAYHGFDPKVEAERVFVMNLLSAASSGGNMSKQLALAELTRLSTMIAKRKTWKELEKLLSVQVIKKIAEQLGIRLTKAKLGNIVPVVGGFVGAGYNSWYLAQVTRTASMMYRERFLAEKFGAAVIQA